MANLMKTIPEEALKELQEALGERNVSADPGVLQVYSYMNSMGGAMTGVWWASPLVVTLPSNTDEVQAVLRVCRKYKMRAKPHSSAWILSALANSSRVVIIDLRRMNDLEINQRDGYAIVQPYCTAGEQQVEIMKLGLNSHVNGAGPNASNLASATSMQGSGGTSQSMSNSERNCLGVELCMPNGEEVLRMGSPGTPNAGWFCGDGPGPSLRGMMRGAIGNAGGHGVYTRCGMKCYPWYLPPFDCNGSPPFFDVNPLPNYELRTCFWPDYDSECDGLYRISESELTDYCARLGPGAYEEAASTTNEEYLSMVESKIYRNTFPKGAWTFSFAASCPEELECRLKTVQKIVDETNGIMIDTLDLGHDAHQLVYQTAIRGCYIFKAAFMPTGSWMCFLPMSYETIDNLWKVNQPINDEIKKELIAKEQISDDYYDNVYASLDENGHFGHVESPYHTELWEPKEQCLSGMIKGLVEGIKHHVPILYSPQPLGEDLMRYTAFIAAVTKLIDPDGVMDGMGISSVTNAGAGMSMGGKTLDEIDDLETMLGMIDS